MGKNHLTTPLLLLTSAIVNHNAAAQVVLEEVIVTAQKRAENLQDTAIAITAVSNQDFDDLNITNGADFEAIVPSLSVRQTPNRVFIRGVGRVTNTLGTDPGVAVYVDQFYNSESSILNFTDSLTTERVEILRGPQGTLFGRNTTGGAINVTTARPTEDFEHQVRAKVGNYDRLDLGASSAGPITDDLRYRVFGSSKTRDGFIDNDSGNDIWEQDDQYYGAQLSWDATDALNIWVAYNRFESGGRPLGFPAGVLISPYLTDVQGVSRGLLANPQYEWTKENPTVRDSYRIDQNDTAEVDTETNQWLTHLTYDFDNVTLRYLGGIDDAESESNGDDYDKTSNPEFRQITEVGFERDKYSHELQLLSESDSPLQWVVGAYYYHEEVDQPTALLDPLNERMELVVPPGSTDLAGARQNPDRYHYQEGAELEIDSRAIYGDFNYSFDNDLKLTVGMRYSEDEKKGYETQLVTADPAGSVGDFYGGGGFPDNCCGWDFTPEPDERKLSDEWDSFSGRIVLDYYVNDDTMVYGSVSSGYKSGGFSVGPILEDPGFDEETLVSYEIGYKATIAQVLRLNAAAYFYDYEDMQVQTTFINDAGVSQTGIVNAPEAEVKGLELEATWLATENLSFLLNYSYIDGEYTDFCCVIDEAGAPDLGEQDLSGTQLTQTPKNKVFFNASYNWTTSEMGDFVISGSYAWVDERQYQIFDNPETLAEDYYRVDAVISWFSPSQAWRVTLAGKNLTEEETFTAMGLANEGRSINASPNEPRTYTAEVQYHF